MATYYKLSIVLRKEIEYSVVFIKEEGKFVYVKNL